MTVHPRAEAGRFAEGEETVGGCGEDFLGCLKFWGQNGSI